MELAIIAGLAFIGNEISKQQSIHKLKENVYKPPFKNDPLLSNNPANFNNNINQPFIKDKGSLIDQQRSLELFTGVNNSNTYTSKIEQEPLFKPERQNIFGNQNAPDITDRYRSGIMMNNVSPIEKIQVGPGLNTSSDVAAKGGFHQYFRILPNNVNEYKKNSFGGRILAGKGITENRSNTGIQEVRTAPSFYQQEQYPTMPGKSAFTAPDSNTTYTPDCTNRGSYAEQTGIAKGNETFQSRINGSRVGNVPLSCLPVGGAAMENAATGSYAVSKYLTHDTDRENCGIVTNANDQSSGTYIKGSQLANMTQREGTSKCYSGTAGFYSNAQSNYSAAQNADQYHKREDVQKEYTPNAGNMNLRQDAQAILGSVKIRNDCNSQRVSIATVPNSMTAQGKPGHIENAPKITECNPRQDFGLVQKTLQGNPYVLN